MRFAAAATLLFAGAVMATKKDSGEYTTVTDWSTISSCAPEVTDCPYRTKSWAEASSSAAPISTTPTTSVAWSKPTGTAKGYGSWAANSTLTASPVSTATGIWECDCEAETSCTTTAYGAGSTGSWSAAGAGPSGSWYSATVSTSSPTSVVTGAAGTAAPALLAIAAGLVAFLA